jgi:ribosome-associated translation inhibitor RaiA
MDIPLQLESDGVDLPDSVRAIIQRQLSILLRRHPRIVSCHLIVRAPNGHHLKGEPFDVLLRFLLPGGEQIEASPPNGVPDPRQSDLRFAVDDAFRRAERRLEQSASRREGHQKQHRNPLPNTKSTSS